MSWLFKKRSFDEKAWAEADHLISLLEVWGISYLVGENAPLRPQDLATDQTFMTSFIQRLARCEYPRVRDASLSLFLVHPELVPSLLAAMQTEEEEVAELVPVLVLAALYLQRLWSARLRTALGSTPSLPEEPFVALWQSRHLPPPAYHTSKGGLLALQEHLQAKIGFPINFLEDWQNQMNHLLLQEEERYAPEPTTIQREKSPFLEDVEYDQKVEVTATWTRPTINQAIIEQFLRAFGSVFHHPARLSLLGTGALIHMGLRPEATYDIDIEVEVDNADETEEMYTILKHLIKQINVHIDFVDPGKYLPLPSQGSVQTQEIGQYGQVRVLYYDFYRSAFMKMLRSSDRDIKDIQLLIQQKLITVAGLDKVYYEVLPYVGQYPYHRLDPRQFAARYAFLHQLLV